MSEEDQVEEFLSKFKIEFDEDKLDDLEDTYKKCALYFGESDKVPSEQFGEKIIKVIQSCVKMKNEIK